MILRAKQQIQDLITAAYPQPLSGNVEIPKDTRNGDYAANHAMASAKKLEMKPRDLAQMIVDNINLEGSYFVSVSLAGPGFINFTLAPKWFAETLAAVESEGADYGRSDVGNDEKVMVEFVSANPTGPMTIGNARGGVLGDALANVLDRVGYNVHREFYVNDAGNQVDLFGKSIAARYMQILFGEDAVEFPENGYHGEDIKDLAKLIHDERGDALASLSEAEREAQCVEFGLPRNIALMKEHLERYRIRYNEWFSETSLLESGYVAETVALLEANGLTYEKDGALWLKNVELGADKDEVLRRSNGFFTYYADDIAYHRNKFVERGFDRVIDVLGADHHGHAVRFKSTISAPALGINAEKLDFLIMQMVRMTRDGETIKVSKRTGRAMSLNDLLDEVSVDACRFFFNAKPDNHLEFDLGLAVRQDSENPVYYVQYAHARICSLLAALAEDGHLVKPLVEVDFDLLAGEHECEIIKTLATLPDELALAARELDPSQVNRYVVELATRVHKFYTACRIKGEAAELISARIKLMDLTRTVIASCLAIIGVEAKESM